MLCSEAGVHVGRDSISRVFWKVVKVCWECAFLEDLGEECFDALHDKASNSQPT